MHYIYQRDILHLKRQKNNLQDDNITPSRELIKETHTAGQRYAAASDEGRVNRQTTDCLTVQSHARKLITLLSVYKAYIIGLPHKMTPMMTATTAGTRAFHFLNKHLSKKKKIILINGQYHEEIKITSTTVYALTVQRRQTIRISMAKRLFYSIFLLGAAVDL
jgi:hypothetical protein